MEKSIDIETLTDVLIAEKPEIYSKIMELHNTLVIASYHQIASTQPGYRKTPYEEQKSNIKVKMEIDKTILEILTEVRPSIMAKGKLIQKK